MMDPEPRAVHALLDWPPVWFVARLLLVGAYAVGALAKLTDWPGAVAEQAHFGMSPPALWAGLTIAVEIVGPLLILTGRLVWLGAGMLGVFTLLAALKANAFWAMAGPARFAATNAFFEHLGLIGGFILAALVAEHARREGRL
ncbi:DoxX family protein [Novosphingobium sp.]|uniref:DoxX family protein n=1 Tax=Novosphingobium sp. TaxID=1874826 RepID=UPI003BACDBB8